MSRNRRTFFNRLRNRLLCGATALGVKLLYLSVRFETHGWDRVRLEAWNGRGAIFAFWHNGLMVPLGHECRTGTRVLISAGSDGEYAARVVSHFGVGAVRGSTSRGAAPALLEVIRSSRPGALFGVTPDGPRGPRYRFQPGTAYLASRSGLPVVAIGIALTRAWKLRSWDRYRIPKPFCRAILVFGPPAAVPPDLDRDGLERERARLEAELHRVSREAAVKAGHAWPD